MLIGVIADDFTGASEVAASLAPALATMLFFDVPAHPAPDHCEAGVVALRIRAAPAHEAVARAMAALAYLRQQGCRRIVFIHAATFESTPQGNIGPVGEVLARALDVTGVPVCAADPSAGRTVYRGHLFLGDRLLDETGLERHPNHPMTDADLRRWLRRQTLEDVGLVPYATVRSGHGAVREALSAAGRNGERLVILDGLFEEDLGTVETATADLPLLIGCAGIARMLPGPPIAQGLAGGAGYRFNGVPGPEAILAGSCSKATLEQVLVHAERHPSLAVDVDGVMAGGVTADDLVRFVEAHAGEAPLVFSSAPPERMAAFNKKYGRVELARALDRLFATTARRLVEAGVQRLVIAGSETALAILRELAIDSVAVGPSIDPGIAALAAADGRPIALVLSSGSAGRPDLFARAVTALHGEG